MCRIEVAIVTQRLFSCFGDLAALFNLRMHFLEGCFHANVHHHELSVAFCFCRMKENGEYELSMQNQIWQNIRYSGVPEDSSCFP